MIVVLAALGIFAIFLLVPEEEAPLIDDAWARRRWLERHKW